MKLPATVMICGHLYSITYDPRRSGGSGLMRTHQIKVGTHSGDQTAWETLVHEILELTACHRVLHFNSGPDIRIVMTHPEFENYAADVAVTMLPLLGDVSRKE